MTFGTAGIAQDLILRMPEAMVAEGFDKQLLPRFKFKHRISVSAVTEGAADAVLTEKAGGKRVFQDVDGVTYRLEILTEDEETKTKAGKLLDWLASKPGKAAIEGFAPDGSQRYSTELAVVVVEAPEEFDGDAIDGSRLALVHCGRCHVIDERNRMGGIGSTPSFAALRGRENWSDLFRVFWAHNPHPSFTQVEGVTEPFDPNRELHVAPVEVTLEEIEGIIAFVAEMEPKNLGLRVQSN